MVAGGEPGAGFWVGGGVGIFPTPVTEPGVGCGPWVTTKPWVG